MWPNYVSKPTVFVSFGGATEGGDGWDDVFNDQQKAVQFGQNAGHLLTSIQNATQSSNPAYIGLDLDMEGQTTTFPYFKDFVDAFRAIAPQSQHPLMMCSYSGLADPGNNDHTKLALMQNYGPAYGGIDFINLMVDKAGGTAGSCDVYGGYWRDQALDVIPNSARVVGVWGLQAPTNRMDDPGCDDLFGWIKQNGIGLGIWEWWIETAGDFPVFNNMLARAKWSV